MTAPDRRWTGLVAVVLLGGLAAAVGVVGASSRPAADPLQRIKHLVVVYQENHSFDNLWGGWPGVDGLGATFPAQVAQDGRPLQCLPLNDVNLTVPPLTKRCTVALADGKELPSHFAAAPFTLDVFIPPDATTCFPVSPATPQGPGNGVPEGKGVAGGCTRDLAHEYYREQYQLDGGKLDRYVTGSDAAGLALGVYSTQDLPLYRYLQTPGAPRHLVADHFFQAAFGGSFLNHQYLIAARTPEWAGADRSGTQEGCTSGTVRCDLHSVVDANGMPGAAPLYRPTAANVVAGALTTRETGDFAVNTIQPFFEPFAPGTPPGKRLPPLTTATIGDRLTGAGISWAWYGGGWANAAGRKDSAGWTNGDGPACADPQARADSAYPNCPDTRFQFHHQPFNYFAAFGDDTAEHRANRSAHLKDEADFLTDLRHGDLPAVSFVKPLGTENAHPGYTSQVEGDRHVVELLQAIQADGEDWPTTAVVLTYDEFGGTADHVAPPRHGPTADRWGPGTRVPAMILSPLLAKDRGVDPTPYDTTSILATIEKRFGLAPLATRDQAVADFSAAFRR